MDRRTALKHTAVGFGVLSVAPVLSCTATQTAAVTQSTAMKGNINHSVCRWCYSDIALDALCEGAKAIGIKSIEILAPNDWVVLQKHGLTCALGTVTNASIANGFNYTKNHQSLYQPYIDLIDKAADNGIPNIIVFSGNRSGISEKEGLENCAVGLDKIVKHAEQKKVMVVMELLNSKVNHPDYQCDHTAWGVELVDKIASPNFKLLYDIYHMQIMEGDIIATIKKYKDYFAHYHTGGVPGRNEINAAQELNYPAIMKAILDTGYKGYVAQEFIPTYQDKLAALKEGVMICDI